MQKTASREVIRRTPAAIYRQLGDRLFLVAVVLLGAGVIAIALLMLYELWVGGAEAIREFGFFDFLVSSVWNPVTQVFGAWPFFLGTVITSLAALALSFFPALAAAIISAEYAPRWLSGLINYFVDLMAAIPSVVLGLWGILVLVPWLRNTFYLPVYVWANENAPGLLPFLGPPTGFGLMTAILALALMIVPFTMALARDAIRLVPREQREAAYALGATRWEVIRMAVLPYARGGIMAGAMLALGRAIGETMVVAMLIGNAARLPFTLFGPAATMPSVIANQFNEAVGDLYVSSLIAIGFYLFLIALVVNLAAAYVLRKISVGGGRA